MKRLLIVDDEHHIVNWLANLFETQEDLELNISKAYTGMDGIKILESTKIDIILLDIKMPGINGLEVADQILSHWPGCRIIFLTGHNNFDYIYYANKHKNITYLLKTETDEEIISAVKHAAWSIDTEIYNIELKNLVIGKERLLQYLYQKEFLRDIVMGKHLKDIQQHLEGFGYEFNLDITKPVIILYGKLNIRDSSPYFIDHSNLFLKLMQITEQVLYNKYKYALLDYDRTTVLWFLQPSDSFYDQTSPSPLLYLKESFDDIIASCQKNIFCDVMLLLYYKIVDWDLVGNVFLLLNQYVLNTSPAHPSSSFGMIFNEKHEIIATRYHKDKDFTNKWDLQVNDLNLYLNQGDCKHFLHILKLIIFKGNDVKSMHYLPLIGLYQRISSMLIVYINKYDLSEKIATQIGLYPLYFINDFNSWEDAFLYIEKLTHTIFDLNKDIQLDKNEKIVKSLKHYINIHLSEDLSLTVLSDYVNYNTSYVSRIFKQTTGMSLSDYICQFRINRAKDFLINTNNTVQDISKMVGFDTSQYFSMVFRKAVGMTPRDFRNQ